MIMILTKVCSRCKVEKPLGEFQKNDLGVGGRYSICIKCVKEKYKEKHPFKTNIVRVIDGKKVCSTCKINKPISDFSISKNSKSGRRSQCKECEHEYRVSHKQQSSEYQHIYYLNNKEKISEYHKNYRILHFDRILKYNEEHKEYRKNYFRNHRLKNIERIKKRDGEYYERNKGVISIRRSKYLKSDRGREVDHRGHAKYRKSVKGRFRISIKNSNRRNRVLALKNTLTLKQWNIILYDQQNNKCAICKKGFGGDLLPTKDHIIPLSNIWCPGLTFGNTQALCGSCNSSKQNKVYFTRAIYTLLEENLEI